MKILRSGTSGVQIYRETCLHCGCAVEFDSTEGREASDPREGTTARVVQCPECNQEIWGWKSHSTKPRRFPK